MTDKTTRRANEQLRKTLDARQEIKVTVTGRTSGREITNPVWFVREGDKLYLVPVGGSDADWYKNALKTRSVRLAAGATHLSARITPISDKRKVDQILDKFRAKYGARDVEAYYPRRDAAVEVPLTHPDRRGPQ